MFSFSLELVIQTWPKEALEVFYTNKESKEFLFNGEITFTKKFFKEFLLNGEITFTKKWDNMIFMILL